MGEKVTKVTRGPKYKRHTDDAIAAALRAASGIVSEAARMLGTSPKVIYQRMRRSPALAEIRDDGREELLDLAETSLRRAVEDGQTWAVMFTLKTLGRTRGYTERGPVERTEPGRERLDVFTLARRAKENREKRLKREREQAARFG